MKQPILSEEQIARLDSIARLGADKIAGSLSKWVKTDIASGKAGASIVHYSKLLEPLSDPEDIVTAIIIKVSGSVAGYLIFLFDEMSARQIVAKVLRRKVDSILDWDDLSRSVMEETGNIIGSAFLNTLAANLNLEIHPSSPVMACDFAGAFLDTMMAQHAMEGEYALTCQITFTSSNNKISGNEISGTFAMLPDSMDAWKQL